MQLLSSHHIIFYDGNSTQLKLILHLKQNLPCKCFKDALVHGRFKEGFLTSDTYIYF